MRKILARLLSLLLIFAMLVPSIPRAKAYQLDLSALMENTQRRRFVEMSVGYYLQNDALVQKTLAEGYPAMFLFDGCSDNMDDEALSDLSYYRVSGVCVVLKLDENGEPFLIYFNDNCSTVPDHPLDFGAWEFEEFGEVGPATVCDGTYQLFSVKHGGVYEALHVRDSYRDGELEAVYMISEGYVVKDATQINIHTRTTNHVISPGMWSAGCMLIGDGEWGQFEEMMESTYYSVYDSFRKNLRVGCVTINRQCLRQELVELYGSQGAVETLLAASEEARPDAYLDDCQAAKYEDGKVLYTVRPAKLMTLPCSNATDGRSLVITQLEKKEPAEIRGAFVNSEGNLRYKVEHNGETGYLYSGDLEEIPWKRWFGSLMDALFG